MCVSLAWWAKRLAAESRLGLSSRVMPVDLDDAPLLLFLRRGLITAPQSTPDSPTEAERVLRLLRVARLACRGICLRKTSSTSPSE
jgi:hypothetical protein